MNTYAIILQATPPPEIPVGVFWSIITVLIGIIVWVAIRYITKLDTLLERLDTAVDDIKATLKIQGQRLDNQELEIKSLKEANRQKRR
jgi:hypothetical protein